MAAQNFLVSSMPSPHSLSIIEQLGISPATIARRGLREFAEADAKTLEWVETAADGCEHRLIPVAAAAWCALTAAAQADGLTLIMISSFRSVQRQAEIIHSKLAIGQTIDEILMSVAPPGYSEHHTGCAVDITSIDHPQLAITFEHTPGIFLAAAARDTLWVYAFVSGGQYFGLPVRALALVFPRVLIHFDVQESRAEF